VLLSGPPLGPALIDVMQHRTIEGIQKVAVLIDVPQFKATLDLAILDCADTIDHAEESEDGLIDSISHDAGQSCALDVVE
jgi:hypothetical protein